MRKQAYSERVHRRKTHGSRSLINQTPTEDGFRIRSTDSQDFLSSRLSEKMRKLRCRAWVDKKGLKPCAITAQCSAGKRPSILVSLGSSWPLLSGIKRCGHVSLEGKPCLLEQIIYPELSFSEWDSTAALIRTTDQVLPQTSRIQFPVR